MAEPLRTGTAAGRWVIAATVLGSGIAFLDGSVVNVALPTIGRDLDTDLAGLQWILDGYLVTLTGLLLLGGSLGDRYGRRRMFVIGLVAFTVASVLCAFAPTATCSPWPGRCRAPAVRCWCRGAWRSSRRRSTPTTVAAPSAPGRRWPGWRPRSVPSSAAGSSSMVVAADLPHQHAHRRRGRGHHAAPRARVERPPRARLDRRRGRGDRLGRPRRTGLRRHRGPGGRRRRGVGRGGAGRRADRRLRGDRGSRLGPDAPPRAVRLPPVHGGQPHDAGRVRRARRRDLPGGAPAAGRAGLLADRGGRLAPPPDRADAAAVVAASARCPSGSGHGSP